MSTLKRKSLKKCHTDKRKMIEEIHNETISNMTDAELSSYYLDNGEILNQYYTHSVETTSTSGILSLLHGGTDASTDDKETKKQIIDRYMDNLGGGENTQTTRTEYNKCKIAGCGSLLKISHINGTMQCFECGYTEDIVVESEKGSYNDPPNESNYFAYKRINHFNEWLSQFQAKVTTDISDKIYVDVHKELKKDIHLDWDNLNYAKVRGILKKLGYNKYYEHIPHIINVLSGKSAPKVDRKTEDTLRALFKDIQEPFIKHCPKDRKNFLSYSYVLFKFCELLEYDDLLMYFPLLKSREKLQQQDIIWEKICEELHWQYIPST